MASYRPSIFKNFIAYITWKLQSFNMRNFNMFLGMICFFKNSSTNKTLGAYILNFLDILYNFWIKLLNARKLSWGEAYSYNSFISTFIFLLMTFLSKMSSTNFGVSSFILLHARSCIPTNPSSFSFSAIYKNLSRSSW